MQITETTPTEFFAAPNADKLLADYGDECRMDGMPEPQANRDLYIQLHAFNALRVFVAKTDEDEIIGFMCIMHSPSLHYASVSAMAVAESFYVDHEYRSTLAAGKLIVTGRAVAKELGSPGLLVYTKPGSYIDLAMRERYSEPATHVYLLAGDA